VGKKNHHNKLGVIWSRKQQVGTLISSLAGSYLSRSFLLFQPCKKMWLKGFVWELFAPLMVNYRSPY
jgi:hypothetical protein